MTPSDAVILYARSFLGVPYIFGGNNRLQGLDCSGFVCEVLRSFGLVGLHEDLNAQGLLLSLAARSQRLPPAARYAPGTVVFFGQGAAAISHVGLMVDGLRMIEAAGGGESCRDVATATKLGAMVRERPLSSRRDLVAAVFPPYPEVT